MTSLEKRWFLSRVWQAGSGSIQALRVCNQVSSTAWRFIAEHEVQWRVVICRVVVTVIDGQRLSFWLRQVGKQLSALSAERGKFISSLCCQLCFQDNRRRSVLTIVNGADDGITELSCSEAHPQRDLSDESLMQEACLTHEELHVAQMKHLS